MLAVSEIFDSIQGEGSLCGMPSTFVRLAGCNLSCSWCDAAYTWKGDVKFDEMTIDEILIAVKHRHVVVTGGEPLARQGFSDLVADLSTDKRHITVETNGTIQPDSLAFDSVDLWSVSPKFGTSGQDEWLNLEVLRSFLGLPYDMLQLKFVIDDRDDWEHALDLLHELNPNKNRLVFVQPNGLCHTAQIRVGDKLIVSDQSDERTFPLEQRGHAAAVTLETPYLDRCRWLYELVEREGRRSPVPIRAVPQIHKFAWGNRRGF